MPDGPSPPACRILCLHGGRQTAQIFSDRISRLVAKASRENVEFKFIDAPFADQRDADGLLKEWYGEDGGAQLSTSLSLIEATIVSDGPFDGLLGFSQGALAVAACAIRPHRFPSLKFCILASAPSTPAPQSWDSTDGAACCMPIEGLPTLHMVSTDDRAVPPAASLSLIGTCFCEGLAECYYHPKGHALPSRADDIAAVVAFIAKYRAGMPERADSLPDLSPKDATGGGVAPAIVLTGTECVAQREAWAEELSALEAIYGLDDLMNHEDGGEDAVAVAEATTGCPRVHFSVRLDGGGGVDEAELPPGELRLEFEFCDGYPLHQRLPAISLAHNMLTHQLPAAGANAVAAAALAAAEEAITAGETAVCFLAVGAANAALADGAWRGAGDTAAASAAADDDEGEDGDAAPPSLLEEHEEAVRAAIVQRMAAEAQEVVAALSPAALLGGGGSGDGATASPQADGLAQQSLRGIWTYRVGLVGKPSAGKSSLFNALTRAGFTHTAHERAGCDTGVGGGSSGGGSGGSTGMGGGATTPAKVGAMPFTTIDPNVGMGVYAAPPDAEPTPLVRRRTATSHGRAEDGRRLLPVTLIDVAGLVPGAYAGRGKGNQFLADLCTADALLHVVDASCLTDAGGNPTESAYGHHLSGEGEGKGEGEGEGGCKDGGGQDGGQNGGSSGRGGGGGGEARAADAGAEGEIEWVAREIHLWVFTNLKTKLNTWRKRPQRLNGMFTGYGASPLLVEGVLRRAAAAAVAEALQGGGGGPPQGLTHSQMAHDAAATIARFASESEVHLHRLVAHFVATRWPTAVALNKADHPSSTARIAACRARFPHRALVATSARAELEALARSEQARQYLPPGAVAVSSNVLDAISRCVALRPPTLCFPCAALHSLTPLTRGAAGEAPPLRDCLQLRPRSTVGDAFAACKRSQLCSGDFVRAEGRAAASVSEHEVFRDAQEAVAPATAGSGGGGTNHHQPRPLRKDDVVGVASALLRLQSTRKSQWQQK